MSVFWSCHVDPKHELGYFLSDVPHLLWRIKVLELVLLRLHAKRNNFVTIDCLRGFVTLIKFLFQAFAEIFSF